MIQQMSKKGMSTTSTTKPPTRKILLLHGDRQTGQLLLGRISSLKRKLLKPRNYDGQGNTNGKKSNNTNIPKGAEPAHLDHRIEFVAPDGPFVWELDPSIHHRNSPSETTANESQQQQQQTAEKNEDDLMRTWWYREGNDYKGLDESLTMLHSLWLSDPNFEGIFGFSRGARLTHLISLLHEASNGALFPNLKYILCASGYGGVSLPSSNFPPESLLSSISMPSLSQSNHKMKDVESVMPIQIKSMHIMGIKDRLITVEQSRALLPSYVDPVVHEHEGGHHIPMRAADVREIIKFIDDVSMSLFTSSQNNKISHIDNVIPDEEHEQYQIDECESMSLIFPDEFQLISKIENNDGDEEIIVPGETKYKHPITYSIQLKPSLEEDDNTMNKKLWPRKDIALKVQYTVNYPDTAPIFTLQHEMNLLEFKISQNNACLDAVAKAAEAEHGMPCVMSCVYAAREFFEGGGLLAAVDNDKGNANDDGHDQSIETRTKPTSSEALLNSKDDDILLKPSSRERIEQCIMEGLEISYHAAGYSSLSRASSTATSTQTSTAATITHNDKSSMSSIEMDKSETIQGKGGSWKYTVGLVGKPSAGKRYVQIQELSNFCYCC